MPHAPHQPDVAPRPRDVESTPVMHPGIPAELIDLAVDDSMARRQPRW
jgi:hypothetical protein